MSIGKELLAEVLKEYIARRNIVSLTKCTSEPAVGTGENFASVISRVRLEGVRGDGKPTKLSLIVKKLPTRESQLQFLESHGFFKTEIKLYKEILPLMGDVLEELGVPTLWPEFLGQKDGYLIFSDLKSKNYRICNRLTRLDYNHSILGMKSLAIFHATSVVLDQRGLLDVSGLKTTFLGREAREIRKYVSGGLRTVGNTILAGWEPEWADIGRRLVAKSKTWTEEMDRLIDVSNNRLNVLNHGDIWTTNIMFKYSRTVDVPIGFKFIDFQLAHYNTYAFDLIMFIQSSVRLELRQNQLKDLITGYARLFKECLGFYGYGHLAPSPEEVEAELKRLSLYKLIALATEVAVMLSEVDDALDFDKMMSDNPDDVASHPDNYIGKYRMEMEQDIKELAKDGVI